MSFYIAVSLVPVFVSGALAIYAWVHRERHAALPLVTLSVATIVWAGAYALELVQSDLPWKLFWARVQYLGIAMVPPLWLWLALSYTRTLAEIPKRALAAFLTVPVITILLVWTNGSHGLIWTQTAVYARDGLSVAVFSYGPWFIVHVAYSYTLMFLASALLLRTLMVLPVYDRQGLTLAIAAAMPWIANMAHLAGVNPLYPLDITPLAFALGGAAIAVGMHRYRFLDLVPVARSTVVEKLHDAVIVLDQERRIVDVNPAGSRVLDMPVDALLGRSIESVLPRVPALLDAVSGEGDATGEISLGEGDRERRYAMHVTPVAEPGGRAYGRLVDLHDITELRDAEARIQFLAYRDPLTSLPNRQLFRDRFEQALAMSRRTGRNLACLFMDLDDFKKVNDHYGHSVGDELLREASQRINTALRDADTVARTNPDDDGPTLARFGGDEFVILLQGIERPQDAAIAAERVVRELRRPFRLGNSLVSVRASAGIALAPQDGNSAEVLLRNADAAMYAAKRHGGDRVQFFTRAINDQVRSRIEIESELHRALVAEQLVLEYQPQFDAETGRVAAVEALVRWDHPTRGRIPPDEFLPIAEESGLIVPLGEWILQQACSDWALLREHAPAGCRMAVNLSPRQVAQPGIAEIIQETLAQASLQSTDLELEVTEGALMRDLDITRGVLDDLRRLGVRVAVDDFGKGSSALAHMHALPLDLIKIDHGFVLQVADPRGGAMVRAIIALAHELGLGVVAEGVESREQLDFLRDNGCDRVQGYELSRPMPRDETLGFLRDNTGWPTALRATA